MKPFEAMTVDGDGFPLDRGTPPSMSDLPDEASREKVLKARGRVAAEVEEIFIISDKTVNCLLLVVVVDGFGG
jgi:hypothetical protein